MTAQLISGYFNQDIKWVNLTLMFLMIVLTVNTVQRLNVA